MSLSDLYWATLSEMVCPRCGRRGMDPDGDLDFCCPDCGFTGPAIDDPEEDEDREDFWDENEDFDDDEDDSEDDDKSPY